MRTGCGKGESPVSPRNRNSSQDIEFEHFGAYDLFGLERQEVPEGFADVRRGACRMLRVRAVVGGACTL